jgi:hypothetical protein
MNRVKIKNQPVQNQAPKRFSAEHFAAMAPKVRTKHSRQSISLVVVEMLVTQNIYEITADKICNKLKMRKASLFHHFKDMEDLLYFSLRTKIVSDNSRGGHYDFCFWSNINNMLTNTNRFKYLLDIWGN